MGSHSLVLFIRAPNLSEGTCFIRFEDRFSGAGPWRWERLPFAKPVGENSAPAISAEGNGCGMVLLCGR
jgi:hypothetical protein